MTPEQLAEIRARAEAATPGPWKRSPTPLVIMVDDPRGTQIARVTGSESNLGSQTDTDFIIHARTDIPVLLDYIEELEAKLSLTYDEAERVETALASIRSSKEPTNA